MRDPSNLQRNDEWWLSRRGKITSSRVHRVVNGKDRGWRSLMSELAAEMRQDTMPELERTTYAMRRGETLEPEALANAALAYGFEPTPVGFKNHPTIDYLGASSDFLVIEDGRIINGEGKAPLKLETHMTAVMTRTIPERYMPQVQLQMEVHGSDLTYFISFHPKAPHWKQRIALIEVPRDPLYIRMMLARCQQFWDQYTFSSSYQSEPEFDTYF